MQNYDKHNKVLSPLTAVGIYICFRPIPGFGITFLKNLTLENVFTKYLMLIFKKRLSVQRVKCKRNPTLIGAHVHN